MTTRRIYHLTSDNFDEFVNNHKVVYVNYWHDNCAPCINLVTPSLKKMIDDPLLPKEVYVVKVNIVEHPSFQDRFGIQGVPSYSIYLDGTCLGTKLNFIAGVKTPIQFFKFLLANENSAVKQDLERTMIEFKNKKL